MISNVTFLIWYSSSNSKQAKANTAKAGGESQPAESLLQL